MTERADQQLKAAKRVLALREAQTQMMPYMKLTMPDPNDPADIEKSRYIETPLARILCNIVEGMYNGKERRVAVSVGPQMGKSQVLSRAGPAWISGRNPLTNIMLGTYNQTFANDFGVDVSRLINSSNHKLVFPNHALIKDAADHLITDKGGKTAFVGAGGSGSGKPADFFFVDDPFRNDTDAQSAAYRDMVWKWFTSVAFTRLHDKSSVLVVHTRWHQDDLIGRLCDPDHPERNKKYAGVADGWTYINLPAVVTDRELADALSLKLEVQTDPKVVRQFGTAPMSSLWPGRKSLPILAEAKQIDSRVFGALYMGRPTPEDGDYFKTDWIVEYGPEDLPKELNVYGASDHAVGQKQGNDSTVLGCAGIDKNDDIWILPDLVWSQIPTDQTVEEAIRLMKKYKPLLWWMESELISKSFGPFLRKRMMEEKVYTYIDPVSVHKTDKQMRARSIQGRMAMKKVHLPRFAPWFADAKAQLVKFPYATHDDFVDFIAHIGQGLTKEVSASTLEKIGAKVYRSGSPNWVLANSKEKFARDKRLASVKGW